jgi:hypothetical protein
VGNGKKMGENGRKMSENGLYLAEFVFFFYKFYYKKLSCVEGGRVINALNRR